MEKYQSWHWQKIEMYSVKYKVNKKPCKAGVLKFGLDNLNTTLRKKGMIKAIYIAKESPSTQVYFWCEYEG